ncbi:acyl-CoA thioesterase [Endozoicomonas ascidiicola]|uniref:acyl-CoA thioesterase n=1 Tax=Endozoicomonas ascidiicola TaxID=1698521 RepID=UPI00082D1F9D|nr:acyl-CoA thioesterase [Endozoicomonas ascidiicola]
MSFTVEMQVRDYECDLQGIVNNSVYFNYLEHARHQFLKTRNLDFAQLAAQKINLVLTRCEIDYKSSLRPSDVFTVSVEPERISRLKIGFRQRIHCKADNQLMIDAFATVTSVNGRGRPFVPDFIEDWFSVAG